MRLSLRKKNKAVADLQIALQLEETLWSRKAKNAWSLGGDSNSKYFHCLVKEFVTRKNIEKLAIDGTEVTDCERLEEHLQLFYSNLYNEPETWLPIPNDLEFKRIEPAIANRLEDRFTEGEVWRAV